MSATSDEELIRAIRAGHTRSLGTLVLRWEQPLFRFVYRQLARKEDARDICQETFLRVLRRADRFRDGSRFSTWMYQIALNLCRDQQRRRRRWGALVVEGHGEDVPHDAARAPGEAGGPESDASRKERREAVARALAELPGEQREVLILKEFEGLKFREIAEITGCPESTVKSRMYYGLNGLKTALERRGIHGE